MMRTGIEEGSFALPKPVPLTRLIFLEQRKLCKSVVSCNRSTYAMASPFVFHEMPQFSRFDDSTNELVLLSGLRRMMFLRGVLPV
jgi:hypothetical protein